MPSKDKVINLFESMIKQVRNTEDNEDLKTPNPVSGNGHVIINAGGNTINVYNGKDE